jgi:hypothetical protein
MILRLRTPRYLYQYLGAFSVSAERWSAGSLPGGSPMRTHARVERFLGNQGAEPLASLGRQGTTRGEPPLDSPKGQRVRGQRTNS